jgi:gliding motility-associated-like protein
LKITNFCAATILDTVKIYDFIPSLIAGPNSSGCGPFAINFSFQAFTLSPLPPPGLLSFPYPYPYPITSYKYNYGDGSPTVATATATHTYTTLGISYASLIVTMGSGCTDIIPKNIYVGQKPHLDTYSVSPIHVCRRDTITFNARASGAEPLNYVYHFGGPANLVLTGVNDTIVKYSYPTAGSYSTYVTAFNYGCPSDTPNHITVFIDSPTAAFSTANHCDSLLKISFLDSSVGASSYSWLFGDGSASVLHNPVHHYSQGIYNPSLAVYNSQTGCHDTFTRQLRVYVTTPAIFVADTAVCLGNTVAFAASHIGPGPESYNWYKDTLYSGILQYVHVDTTTTLYYSPSTVGYHSTMLLARDYNNCIDTLYQKIFLSQPSAGFWGSPLLACAPSTVIFTDTSHDNAGAYITSRTWTYGDGTGNTVTTAATAHFYSSVGAYGVKEIVTDNNGCTDSVYKSAYIHTHKPTANFAAVNTNRCPSDTMTFVNLNAGGLVNGYWTFGDGTSTSAISATHSYVSTGTYTVTLVVTDTAGCKDTLVKTAYITITKPHTAFFINDSTGICAPLVINITNTTSGANTYSWTFGNSNTSIANNPTASYSIPGNYTIQLVATDTHGCKDTAYHHVSLYGNTGTFSYSPFSGCPPLNVSFTANITNIPSIVWDFSDGTVTAPSTNYTITHLYTVPGKYVPRVILGDSAGCHTSIAGADTIRIDNVKAGFVIPATICLYDTVHFTDTSSGLFAAVNSWAWNLGDGATSYSHNTQHIYHAAGIYSVALAAADATGCRDTAVATITVHALPVIKAIGDTLICPGDSARVTVTGGTTYLWGPAMTIYCPTCNPTYVSPVAPTNYIVAGIDAFGCRGRDTVKIGLTYKTVSHADTVGQICTGQSVTLSDSGAQMYSWVPATGLSNARSPHPVASPTYSITYMAIAKTASCIPDTNYVQVTVNVLPKVTTLGAATVIAGTRVNLQAYGPNIVSYLWSHADLLSCEDCTDPIATMQQTTQFTVTAVNKYGCEDSAHVTVDVLCDKSQVFMPNTFTPNGDGENDFFYPRGIGIKAITSFRIYNRWGQLVFERHNIQLNDEHSGWDGIFGGAKPIPDTYIYALDAICDDGQLMNWKGDVTLIR